MFALKPSLWIMNCHKLSQANHWNGSSKLLHLHEGVPRGTAILLLGLYPFSLQQPDIQKLSDGDIK